MISGSVAKVLVIGDVYTGKTSVIRRYAKDQFNENYQTTIGVDFSLKETTAQGEPIKVQLWDIAGQERFQGLQRIFYANALAGIVVYDLFNRASFQSAAKWKKDVDQKVFLPSGARIPVLLLGNKCDLIDEDKQPAMTDEEIKAFASENNFFAHYKCSAKSGENIISACDALVSQIGKNNKSQMTAAEPEPENAAPVIDLSLPADNASADSGGCC